MRWPWSRLPEYAVFTKPVEDRRFGTDSVRLHHIRLTLTRSREEVWYFAWEPVSRGTTAQLAISQLQEIVEKSDADYFRFYISRHPTHDHQNLVNQLRTIWKQYANDWREIVNKETMKAVLAEISGIMPKD